MKILLQTLLILSLLSVSQVEGEVPGGRLPLGSTNVVETYDAQSSKSLLTILYQVNGGHTYYITNASYDGLSFTSLTQVIADYTPKLQHDAQSAVSTQNTNINKDEPIMFGSLFTDSNFSRGYLYTGTTNFTLIKTNGGYVVPDLSWLVPRISPELSISVTNIKWGRIEVRTADASQSIPLGSPIIVEDSRYTSNPIVITNCFVDITNKIIGIPIIYATSGTSGPYRLKVSVVSGTSNDFEIFDSLGDRIPETLIKITNFVYGSTILFDVVGGDPGRVFVIDQSTNLVNWSSMVGNYTVPDNQSIHISFTSSNNKKMFFRVKAISAIPN